jgi:hypothetical protein
VEWRKRLNHTALLRRSPSWTRSTPEITCWARKELLGKRKLKGTTEIGQRAVVNVPAMVLILIEEEALLQMNSCAI